MNTLTGGKSKKQAGLGNIDSRLAEIRDATTALFYPPDKMVVITFLFLYLEILYGCLYMDKRTLEDTSSQAYQTNTSNSFISEFNQIKIKIKDQYFYKSYADLLGLSNPEDPLIKDIESIFSNTLAIDDSHNVSAVLDLIQELMKEIKVLEQEIGRRFSLGLDQENLSPVGRFIVGTFLLIYLELFSLSVADSDLQANVESSSMRASGSSLLVTAIKQEYFYAQRDKLLTGSLKTEFDKYFQEQAGEANSIKDTEQKIFLCLKPLMPF